MANPDTFDNLPSIPNKLLNEDGTITDFDGNTPENVVDAWRLKRAIPNKILNPDGSYSPLTDVVSSSSAGTPYRNSVRKIKPYLYEIEYDSLDYAYAKKHFEELAPTPSACASIRKNNFYGRNFDWTYDNNIEAIIKTTRANDRYASIGVANISDITEEDALLGKSNKQYRLAPFRLVDGINEYGVFANTNVVPTDKGITVGTVPTGDIKVNVCTTMLIRFVLDKFTNATDAVTFLSEHAVIFTPQPLIDMGYDCHFMIGDTEKTYLLEFIENEVVVTDMTDGANSTLAGKPYMTNFHLSTAALNYDGTVYTPETQDDEHNAKDTNLISDNGCGLERYNVIANTYYNMQDTKPAMRTLLDELKYTRSYDSTTDPFWYTEFVGINGLTVISTPEEYQDVVEDAMDRFEHRSRDPESEYFGTWQTTHSAIYDIENRKLYIVTQEDGVENEFSFDYYYTAKEINGIVEGLINQDLFIVVETLPATGEHNKIYLVPDGHGMFDEYFWNVSNQWDKIGNIDLTNMATKEEVSECLQTAKDYTDTEIASKITSALGGAY